MMNLTDNQIIAVAALAIGAYWLGKKHQAKAAAVPAAQTNIPAAAEWWSYAGTWGM